MNQMEDVYKRQIQTNRRSGRYRAGCTGDCRDQPESGEGDCAGPVPVSYTHLPQCIVLDEPTAMLDPNGRKDVIKTVQELNRAEGITILLITHYMEEVIDADRVIVMDGGKVVMDGTPKEIFSRVDELKSYRLDVPQVTELAYELKKGGAMLPDGILRKEELMEALLPLLKEE